MASLLTKVLNVFGLHTEAELAAARAGKTTQAAPAAPADTPVPETDVKASFNPLADTSTAGLIYRQAAIDIPQMPVALQTQVKAQSIEKIRKLEKKGVVTPAEFEVWKRRILIL
ncbi:hypothetical protein [Sutterella sp.]|uniref:hypothetical protein n=1 Tax=Sutterella sp. TaxID=1981025 RepID=UPI003FD77C8D